MQQNRSLTRLRVSLALSFALLALPSAASAIVTAPSSSEHRWLFDEPDGTTAYDDIGALDGTLGSSATRTSGPFGSNVITIVPTGNYDTEGYVDFGNEAGSFGTADFTITHWYKTSFSGSGNHGDIIGNRVAGSLGNYFSARLLGNGQISVEISQNTSGANYVAVNSDTSFGVNNGQWHHLAYVREGATLSLYIDGVLATSGTASSGQPASINGVASFRVGRRLPASYSNFHTIPASYEDVRIFDHALSEGEVVEVFDGVL